MFWYKRHIGDYSKKAGRLSILEHGAYTLLLDACYDRERFPSEDEAIDWCWARSDEEIAAVRFVLSKFFTLVDGVYVQSRITEEIEKYKAQSETNARIAKEREARRKTLHARSVDEPPPNQEPENQEPENQEPKKKRASAPSCPPDVSQQVWNDWLALRKAKKAPVTETVISAANSEAQKAGMTLENFLRIWCARGSQGLQAEWLKPAELQAGRKKPQAENFAERDYGTGVMPL